MFSRSMTVSLSVVLTALFAASASAQVVIEPKHSGKPEIWRKSTDADIKKAEDAARADAAKRLVEAVYLLPCSSARDVMDMMLKNEQVNKALIAALKKAKQADAKYLEDGTVRIELRTNSTEVVSILKKAYEKVDWDLAEEDSVIAAVARYTKPKQKITATGEGALAGSAGAKRIPVRRAALLKGKQNIALQCSKLVLREDDNWRKRIHLRDFALAFKQVPKKIALGLATARIHSETWGDDGSVEMRVELNVVKVAELISRAQAHYDKRRKWAEWGLGHMVTWTKDRIFHADVKAAPGDAAPEDAILAVDLKAVDEALKITPKK